MMIMCITILLISLIGKLLLSQVNPKFTVFPVLCAAIVISVIFAEKYQECIELASHVVTIDPRITGITTTILITSIGEKLADTTGERGLAVLIKSVGYCNICAYGISIFSDTIKAISVGGYI